MFNPFEDMPVFMQQFQLFQQQTQDQFNQLRMMANQITGSDCPTQISDKRGCECQNR